MKTNRLGALVVLGFLASACSQASSADAPPPEPAAATPADAALEEALANAETGKDPIRTRTTLEELLAGSSLSKEDKVRVDKALARLLRDSDRERAVALLEDAVALGDEDAPKRLFAELTGHQPPSPWRSGAEPTIAPVAHALARYFPDASGERDVQIEQVLFGGTHELSERIGTFEIAGVLRQKAQAACGLCDEVRTKIHTSRSRMNLWSSIPREQSRLEHALVVLYVDETTMVPERYAKWLAAPIADVKKAIEEGKGLYAVKERPGAPPIVTLAAPRDAQLPAVEEAFAKATVIPREPVTVPLAEGLSKDEIRTGVRNRLGAFKQCFDALLARSPNARGKLELAFSVTGAGAVSEPRVTLDAGLDDPTFRACTEKVLSSVRYEAWSKDARAKTTVRYPIELTP